MGDLKGWSILGLLKYINSPKSNQTKGLLKNISEEKKANEETTPELNPQKQPVEKLLFRESFKQTQTRKRTREEKFNILNKKKKK